MHCLAYVLTAQTSPDLNQLMSLHRRTPDAPSGEWDAYSVGGRWNGHFRGLRPHDAEGNVTAAERLLAALGDDDKFVPAALVTLDGRWRDEMGCCEGKWRMKPPQEWAAEVRRALVDATEDTTVTIIDYHC